MRTERAYTAKDAAFGSPGLRLLFVHGACRLELVTVGDQELLGEEDLGSLCTALGVLGEDVDLDVEQGAGEQAVEAGGCVGVGDDGDLDDVVLRGRRR